MALDGMGSARTALKSWLSAWKIAMSIVKFERHRRRMIEVKIKAELVDIVIIQIYMPKTRHEEEEVENMHESENIA